MRKYQVLSRDGYGTTLILETTTDLEKALARISAEVTNANFENALTTDDKYRTIEAYFPIFTDEAGNRNDEFVYAGNNTDGRHRVYRFGQDGSMALEHVDPEVALRIFIGIEGDEERFLQDTRRQQVASLNEGKSNRINNLLEGKTHYFIKVIG